MHVEQVDESSKRELIQFLLRHEEYTLFLLGNFEAHGYVMTDAVHSGNFKLVRADDRVCAAFCLTRGGNLLVYSETDDSALIDLIVESCREEVVSLRGLLGEWEFCAAFWSFLKDKGAVQETFASQAILYSVDLSQCSFSPQPHVRLLIAGDYAQWRPLRLRYIQEENIPNNLSEKQMHEQFVWKTDKKIAWGFFQEGTLVSIADLNAKALDLGQVGGVYTVPEFRRRGFSKAVLKHLMHDAKNIHSIRKLIIFTGVENIAARKVYEPLGGQAVGYFAIFFGK